MRNEFESEFAEQVRINQQKLAANLPARFDYVVCGAGTSGCVVAARLAADPATRVLVLEAGGTDDIDMVTNPDRWPLTLGTDLDWGFVAEANPNLNGRSIPYSMGKVLGGGSSINVSTWSRGHRADWSFYASEAGDPSWSYEAVLDLYRHRIEDWTGAPDEDRRGSGGRVHVQSPPIPHSFALALLDGAASVGLKRYSSSNGRMMEMDSGCALVDETVREGRRRSIFRSYLHPLMNRPNITVLTGALVTRIVFEGHRARGVEFEHEGRATRVEADREIVVSLGAIHTPKLLMQSGIGDEAELQRVGITPLQVLPGVGRNLHDHVAFACIWEATDRDFPKASRSQTACFWKSEPSLASPNFYAYSRYGPLATAEILSRFKPPAAAWSLVVGMTPHSRGTIHLTGSAPLDPVRIEANYLGDGRDLEHLVAGVALARDIGNSAPLRPFSQREVAPGQLGRAELERFFRDSLGTFWHQSGTAKMGRDANSVVDAHLRVYGVERLRIADASILPRVTTGNTMAPCVVIGERAADLLRQG